MVATTAAAPSRCCCSRSARSSLAGARLGAQRDFTPAVEYQPDVGPEPDLDAMRLRLAEMLGAVDTYSYVFDPYQPGTVETNCPTT